MKASSPSGLPSPKWTPSPTGALPCSSICCAESNCSASASSVGATIAIRHLPLPPALPDAMRAASVALSFAEAQNRKGVGRSASGMGTASAGSNVTEPTVLSCVAATEMSTGRDVSRMSGTAPSAVSTCPRAQSCACRASSNTTEAQGALPNTRFMTPVSDAPPLDQLTSWRDPKFRFDAASASSFRFRTMAAAWSPGRTVMPISASAAARTGSVAKSAAATMAISS